MQYTTTFCRNCGYKTRNSESNIPNVQIGVPILKCPQCGHLILDTIATEYEFMTNKEREFFTSKSANSKSIIANTVFIIIGIIFLIAGMATGGVVFGLLFGGGCICLGVFQIVKNSKILDQEIIEQCIYESLQRTSNPEYVERLKYAYSNSNVRRCYRRFKEKEIFMEQYNKFESRETYKQDMRDFNELLNLIISEKPVEESSSQTFNSN